MSEKSLPAMRIDKFLWFVRVAKSRALAQDMSEQGFIRLNGRRVDRAHTQVRVGDLITVPVGLGAKVLRIQQMPLRRGPAGEAASCYEELQLGLRECP
jgi:ribosome-associated heat shock protein Hsp15